MYLISAKEYGNAGVDLSRGKKTGKTWAKIKNVQDGLGVQNISDLVSKEIYAIYKTKNLTKYQIKKHKLIEREVFEKYYNLSEDELNTKSNENFYVKNDGSRKKIVVPDLQNVQNTKSNQKQETYL